MLNIHVNSLRRLRYQGKGPVYIEIGKRIFYDPADMDNFINQQKRDGDK